MALFGFLLIVTWAVITYAIIDESNDFVYPGFAGPFDNIPWQIGTTRTLKWYTSLSAYNITLWQRDPVSRIGTIYRTSDRAVPSPELISLSLMAAETTNNNGAGNQSFEWHVEPLSASLITSPVFFLWGGPSEKLSSGFVSASFNMTYSKVISGSVASTIISIPSTPTGQSAPLSRAADQATATLTPDPTPQPVQSLSRGAIAGIAVGVSVFLGGSIGGVILILGRRKRSQGHGQVAMSSRKDHPIRFGDVTPLDRYEAAPS